jgi:serine/threonine protein kinase/dipeptidyl aminopeptidase/acylaminoacyl peptidase
MGEVYSARDTRLARAVAIKVLPPEMANDPERRRRFEREARAVAALNHPHVVTVYDVGEQDGIVYLIQELVEGDSLRALIDRRELSMRGALALAAQIADGLAAAHHAAIVHRDLKPENIMVTGSSRGQACQAKILDFGLARPSGVSAAAAEASTQSMLLTADLTQAGVLLGTLGYMSPEQVRGQTADARSDIFSFGVVLYEMLSGKRGFHRSTKADTLSAILKEDPEELPSSVPAGVRRVVQHCLEKDPANRFQSAKDLGFAIQALGGGTIAIPLPEAASSSPVRRQLWPYGATAAVAVIAGIFAGAYSAAPPVDLSRQRHRLVVSRTANFTVPRWAPDGKSFAYNDRAWVMVQSLDAATPSAVLRDTSEVPMPFFSPDGTHLYFTSGSSGRSVWMGGTAGGEPQPLIKDLGGAYMTDGAALSRDGQSLVVAKVTASATSLYFSSPPGAPLQSLPGALPLPASASRIRLRFSHDGRKLLALAAGTRLGEESHMWILPWPPGSGTARQIQKALRLDGAQSSADWLLDNRHLIVAAVTGRSTGGRFLLVDTESDESYPLTPNNSNVAQPSVGPDGRILYSQVSTAYDLVQVPIDGSTPADLLATDWTERFGAWSRDGSELVYVSDRGGEEGLWVASANGSWQRQVAAPQDIAPGVGATFRSPEFSPDGKRLAYVGGLRVWVSPASGGRPTAVTPVNETAVTPTWSADGNWIAYREGTTLKKVRVGSSAAPVPIAQTDTVPVIWSPDGKWITLGFDGGIGIISPDGSRKRLLIHRPFAGFFASLGWSRDSAVLYLLDRVGGHYRLSAFDIAGGSERVIRDYPPSDFNYSELTLACARLYPSADGKSLLAPRYSFGSSVWLLEGVEPPRGLWRRLLHR